MFLICSTDIDTFDMVIGTSPVVGTHERFVVPADIYFTELEIQLENVVLMTETMAELGITLQVIV